VPEKVQPANVFVAGSLVPAAGVGVAAPLHLGIAHRVRLDRGADVGDRLLGLGTVGVGERLPLALRVVAGFRERDALHGRHPAVCVEQLGNLAIDRDAERVLPDRRFV
jgi:hypothetical protein